MLSAVAEMSSAPSHESHTTKPNIGVRVFLPVLRHVHKLSQLQRWLVQNE
jgi:hypothetical protein